MNASIQGHQAPRVPAGFRLSGVHCGIKTDPQHEDLVLCVAQRDATAAGVYTQNRIVAAPVTLDRRRTPSENIRVVVLNSGNANACTGQQGMRDAESMARLAAMACGVQEEQVLVMSTGVIGEMLDMDKIRAGVSSAAARLGDDDPSLLAAARGMMTTDTVHKVAGRTIGIDNGSVQITGLAKGSGMIGPRMATMLGILLTDAVLSAETSQQILSEIVDETFNCISVEGHTSTNDTVLLLSSGQSDAAVSDAESRAQFMSALREVCLELARSIPNDGEGASHLIEVEVVGGNSLADARKVARTIADSPLVKTAIAGADPNWGRIVSAAGYAGVEFDPQSVDLSINGTTLFRQGTPVHFDVTQVSTSMRENRETKIVLRLGEGEAGVRFWTSDLTAEYVRINADYHT